MEPNSIDMDFIPLSTETVYNELPDQMRNYRTQTNEGIEQYLLMCLPVLR